MKRGRHSLTTEERLGRMSNELTVITLSTGLLIENPFEPPEVRARLLQAIIGAAQRCNLQARELYRDVSQDLATANDSLR